MPIPIVKTVETFDKIYIVQSNCIIDTKKQTETKKWRKHYVKINTHLLCNFSARVPSIVTPHSNPVCHNINIHLYGLK